jgi:hypothetical protein
MSFRIRGSNFGSDKRFSPVIKFHALCGVPFSLLFNIYGSSFWGLKRSEREADHSTSSRAEAKNDWNYNSTLPRDINDMDTDKSASFDASFTPTCGPLDATCVVQSLFVIQKHPLFRPVLHSTWFFNAKKMKEISLSGH